jgi:hypothetical protein
MLLQPESVLFESLRRLELMGMSMNILEVCLIESFIIVFSSAFFEHAI